jgi:hypothetical protein
MIETDSANLQPKLRPLNQKAEWQITSSNPWTGGACFADCGIGSHAIEARTDKRILNRVLKREKRERAELVKRLT